MIEFVQGKLTEKTQLAVETHISGCSVCQKRLEEETKLRGLISSLKGGALRKDWSLFNSRMQNRLQAHPLPPPLPQAAHRSAMGTGGARGADAGEGTPSKQFAFWKPIFVGVFLLVAVWVARKPGTVSQNRPTPFILASDHQQKTAQQAFKEMNDLFPQRINWISFVDGKMDFGVSADPQEATGKNLGIAAPRPGRLFEPRFYLQPGQDVSVKAPWGNTAEVSLRVSLSKDGRRAHVLFRLFSATDSASLEGTATLSSPLPQELGTLKWEGNTVDVQVSLNDIAVDSTSHGKTKL